MSNTYDEYKNLDKYQKRAVTTKYKNVLLIAGAGSGKTFTITYRVKYLINVLNINPNKILCISFTNDAVNNLKEELNNKSIDVLTFHKLALKIIGNKKEILTEDMLIHIVESSFNNDRLYAIFNMDKNSLNNLVVTFIKLFKANCYELDDFYKMIKKADYKDKLLLKEIMKCYICYETYLKKENLIDFSDMIRLAIKKVDKSDLIYKYIIIDEYQDTSYSKYLLIKKILNKNKGSIFAVGDDFQSIYRFAGSNISMFTKFKKYFPFAKIYKLKYTYRNPYEVVKLSNKFVMKNPIQIRKKMLSNVKIDNSIEVIYYDELDSIINKVIKEDSIDDLLILSRNNNDLQKVNIKENIKYRKLSVHRSKGLGANYVFVINLCDSINGFPNKFIDHNILKYVNNYKEYYPYEEERRLFYVALTRCKRKVYLFVPIKNPSIFIEELLKMNKKINIREK